MNSPAVGRSRDKGGEGSEGWRLESVKGCPRDQGHTNHVRVCARGWLVVGGLRRG